MSISLVQIWSLSEEVAKDSLKQLLDRGYTVKTSSENIYIQIVSALTGTNHQILTKLNNELISDTFFLHCLEKAEEEGLNKDDILVKAVQDAKNSDLKRIVLHQEKIKNELKEKEQVSLLENTYDVDLEETCPFNENDKSRFYFNDPKTGESKLLNAHHIFQYKQHCYDIDTVFHFINEGGNVPLDSDYIRRFFNKNGSIDMSGIGLTSNQLRMKVYHSGVRVMYLDNNSIDSLIDTHLPETLEILSVNNNPLKGSYFLNKETPKLLILSMQDCNFDKIDCQYLPQSLKILNVSNNKNLVGLYSLSNMRNLKRLDVRNTNIKKIDWSHFKTVDPKKKMVVLCDRDVNFKKVKPDWIELRYED